MRTALILSGNVRILEDTFPSLEHHILNRFEKIDVFFYGCENKFGKDNNKELINKLLSPVSSVVNERDFYTDEIGCKCLSEKVTHGMSNQYWNNSIWAFYNVMKCNDLKTQYEKKNGFEYDFVIRSRTDLFWFREISEEELIKAQTNIVIPWDWAFRNTPPWNGRHPFGYADLYAFANNNLFNHYSKAYEHITDFSEKFSYAPESFLGYYLHDQPVFESPKHIITEYPIIERDGLDGNGEKLPENYFHPKVWSGEKDFNVYDLRSLSLLKRRYD